MEVSGAAERGLYCFFTLRVLLFFVRPVSDGFEPRALPREQVCASRSVGRSRKPCKMGLVLVPAAKGILPPRCVDVVSYGGFQPSPVLRSRV